MNLTSDDLYNISEFIGKLGDLLCTYGFAIGEHGEGELELWDSESGDKLGLIEFEGWNVTFSNS